MKVDVVFNKRTKETVEMDLSAIPGINEKVERKGQMYTVTGVDIFKTSILGAIIYLESI